MYVKERLQECIKKDQIEIEDEVSALGKKRTNPRYKKQKIKDSMVCNDSKRVLKHTESTDTMIKKDKSSLNKWTDSIVYELKSIAWPSVNTVLKKTGITIAVSVILGFILYGFDLGFELLSSIIFR